MSKSEQIFAQIMRARGLSGSKAERFLQPNLEDLHDPLLLPGIKPAIRRLEQALKRQELVVIYGDYDIDGLCATTILLRALEHLGFKTEAFIPNRFEQGYGLKREALAGLIKKGTGLVITVDCGTSAVEEISWAAAQGLDIIVTDHHEPGPALPKDAVAVINPKRRGSRYPFRELAGSGVAYKLVQALQTRLPGLKPGSERWLLDLVAFATICDVVPLVDENRTLAYFGLKLWPKTRWPGLKALSQTTGISGSDVSATTLGYVFGPRLNAAGRIEHAALALELLTTNDLAQALEIAQDLEVLNQQRKQEQNKIETAALARMDEVAQDPVIILADADWSHGVVGIVASRIMEQTGKPTFLLQLIDEQTAKGSARSFGGFEIAAALASARHILISGGGHAAAGGLSLASSDLEDFKRLIFDHHKRLSLPDESHLLKRPADVRIKNLNGVNLELCRLMEGLQPFGQSNPEPLLDITGLSVMSSRPIGQGGQHRSLTLADNDRRIIRGVMFSPKASPVKDQTIAVTAKVKINDFGGRRNAELIIEGWQSI